MPTPRRVTGARVLATGGASGLGALIATELAIRGASHVTLWDRDEAGMQQVADRLALLGCPALCVPVDLTSPDQITEAGEQTLDATGGIDIIVNSAGIVSGKDFSELTDAEVVRTFEVNTLALYRTTRVVLPGMLRRDRGVVVTMASAAGFTGVAQQTGYSASKFAAVGFTESLRAELRKSGSGVRTLLVCPYYVNTGMFDGVRTKVPLLLPILDANEVAKRVVDAIEARRQRLVMPGFAGTVLGVKMLPPLLADKIIDLFGINATMEHFVGRR